MQCALNYVMQKKDGSAALRLINSILEKAGEAVTVNDVKEQLKTQYGEDPEDILGETCVTEIISFLFLQESLFLLNLTNLD